MQLFHFLSGKSGERGKQKSFVEKSGEDGRLGRYHQTGSAEDVNLKREFDLAVSTNICYRGSIRIG